MRIKAIVGGLATLFLTGVAFADLEPWKDYDISDAVWAVTTVKVDANMDDDFLFACGFRRFGPMALRVDIADRLARMAHERSRGGAFVPDHAMLSLAGTDREHLGLMLKGLGYVHRRVGKEQGFAFKPPRREKRKPAQDREDGAFGALSRLRQSGDD